MARAKKGGPPRHRDSDGDFTPKKKGSPQKKTASPRKGRKPHQQDTVDEGIAATPEDSIPQTHVEKDDSTYASSPPKPKPQSTPLQTPVRKNAARRTRSRKVVVDASLGSLDSAPASATKQSKVVVLKTAAPKLRQVLEAYASPTKKVTFRISPEKLQEIQRVPVGGEIGTKSAEQPQGPAKRGTTADMAPVKDKTPHDVLDGGRCPLRVIWK